MDDLWEKAQEEISEHLAYLLLRVEYHYGENRAPYCFPADFEVVDGEYRCVVIEDYTGDYGKTTYTAPTPAELVEAVKTNAVKDFGLSSIFESPETEPE